MNSTLENERKRIHHQNDKYVNRAVELNSERYTKILTNRINTEAIKLERKIESELRSGIHNGLSEAQTRNVLQEKYQDTAKARIRNIIRDSVHTNESNISFINALNEGYNYKIWMNGRSKGKTISNTTEKVTSKIKQITKKITSKIKTPKANTKNYNHKGKQQKNTKSKIKSISNNFKNKLLNKKYTKHTTKDGKHTINVKEITGKPKKFRKILIKVKEFHLPENKWRVDVHNYLDYTDCKLFITKNGSTIAITPDGDIISVCANPLKGKRDSGKALLEFAVEHGGTKLDSFDGNFKFYQNVALNRLVGVNLIKIILQKDGLKNMMKNMYCFSIILVKRTFIKIKRNSII